MSVIMVQQLGGRLVLTLDVGDCTGRVVLCSISLGAVDSDSKRDGYRKRCIF